jgi:chaperone required for assembly of F1-ATPase
MTSLTGSALLALAVDAEEITPEQAWRAAHVDEDWQIEHWGAGFGSGCPDAMRAGAIMNAAARMIAALRPSA